MIGFLEKFFKNDSGGVLPEIIEIDYTDFLKFRHDWMLYRAIGHTSESGAFIRPITFTEAMKLPQRMLNVFLVLDDTLAVMRQQDFDRKHPTQKSYK